MKGKTVMAVYKYKLDRRGNPMKDDSKRIMTMDLKSFEAAEKSKNPTIEAIKEIPVPKSREHMMELLGAKVAVKELTKEPFIAALPNSTLEEVNTLEIEVLRDILEDCEIKFRSNTGKKKLAEKVHVMQEMMIAAYADNEEE